TGAGASSTFALPGLGMEQMRRSIGIVLLLFFAFTLVGVHPLQEVLREMARAEMVRNIAANGTEEGVTQLHFALDGDRVADPLFAWEEEDEFTYDGRLYDVVRTERTGDHIVFFCIPDEREDSIVASGKELDPYRTGGPHKRLVVKCALDGYTMPATLVNEPRSCVTAVTAHPVDERALSGHGTSLLRPPIS
ncbi:MAG TPA: hypothetical protein PK760_14855, partial [Flavobacteriales bacterium]|nr:hypothetical protein [Flavobacteriales bacterium]